MASMARKEARVAMMAAVINPRRRPTRFIQRAAGMVVRAVPIIITATGMVAMDGVGESSVPMMPPSRTTTGAPDRVRA